MEGEGGREREGEGYIEGERMGSGHTYARKQANTHTHLALILPLPPLLPQLAHSTVVLQGYTALLVLVSSRTVECSTYMYMSIHCTYMYTTHVLSGLLILTYIVHCVVSRYNRYIVPVHNYVLSISSVHHDERMQI